MRGIDKRGRKFTFVERILPGAFKRALEDRGLDIAALVNHDEDKVLGRTGAGTLALREDARGLLASVDPPDTSYGRDLLVSVKRGDINGMSFGFDDKDVDDQWAEAGGVTTRTLSRVSVHEITFATFPCYPETDAAVRSYPVDAQPWLDALADRYRRLRIKSVTF